MKDWTNKKWNNILGGVMFVIAAITYLSTIQPELSFWDCGEYISSAVKLQVTHAPGAALVQLVGAVAAMLAFGHTNLYSAVINSTSAIYSAVTILFLFWTITHLVRRILKKEWSELTKTQSIGILFSGAVGALAFTFSDTFWFSAVEGEVYAMTNMFIAVIIWSICKWEEQLDEPGSDRWIIFIFFLTGLSLGVHMMVMLSIPAVCLIFYARKYKFTWKGFIIANVVTLAILAFVFKGIFVFLMAMFAKFEIFFVNGLNLPFNSGTIFAILVLIGIFYFLLKYAIKHKSRIMQTIVLSLGFMIIGFSCWVMIPIRATANPAINLNDPDNALGMKDYYNRVQYGDWPTIYGQDYTAYLDYNGIEKNSDGSYKTTPTGDIYEKNERTGRYDIVGVNTDYVYNPKQESFMPRMFDSDKSVIKNYMSMYGAPDFTFNYSNSDLANDKQAVVVFDQLRKKYDDGEMTYDDYMNVKQYDLINVKRPSFGQNFDYFISFQNGYYFIRYLLWNFVGRQNGLEGNMEVTKGNWISGIAFLDNYLYGNQSTLPAKFKNESTVAFFFLPLILGLIGFFFQLNKDFGRFYGILALFFTMSVAIIFYTGVKPFEPRERDYAMVGSFYTFAIWIGLGAAAIFYFVEKKIKLKSAGWIVGILLLGIPFMMGFQNYRPHDRSHKYAAYDYAYSFLKSLPKQDIMITYGDNDTYPVWGIQQTQGFRSDVRVAHQALLGTPWFISQMMRKVDNSNKLPLTLTAKDYDQGVNDQIYLMDKTAWQQLFQSVQQQGGSVAEFAPFQKYLTQDSMTVKDAINFIKMKSPAKNEILKMLFGTEKYEKLNFLPVNKFILPVNVQNAVKAGIIKPQDASQAVKEIVINYKDNMMMKNNLVLLDLLSTFNWTRPISFSVGGAYDPENFFYLDKYLQFDGFSYRLVPIESSEDADGRGDMGRVDGDDLYNIVNNYRWGNFKDLYNYFSESGIRNIISYRLSAGRAAQALAAKGENKKALEVLDLASREIPSSKYNDPRSLVEIMYGYLVAGNEKKALELADQMKKEVFKYYDYYQSLTPAEQKTVQSDMGAQPYYYSMIVGAVSDGYSKLGKKDKALDYIIASLQPIDKRYNAFVNRLKMLGKEKAFKESGGIKKITPFYQAMFDVMKPYDSMYGQEKMSQITTQMVQLTQ